MVGTTLSHYEIVELLGVGGMGEVYRARDTKLKRDVAIKLLPAELASDPDRLARLEREAHLLAALKHPNVATIYGLEETEIADGAPARFLVLELVEGETLEERLRSGPLEVDEALEIAVQIARGLEASHEKGIIHRDLKPGNIKIIPDGLVKVLDFGLAKPSEAVDETTDEEGLTHSPTVTVAGTEAGMILGTAAYMSPEQARGKAVDQRTDVWSFGCVLYEMLVGRKPFVGEDVSETLASVLKERPDWAALPTETPLIVRGLLRRCLRKDPGRRVHHIADARIEIEDGLGAPAAERTASRSPSWRGALVSFAVAAIALAVAAGVWLRTGDVSPPVRRATIRLPAGQHMTVANFFEWPAALAPDGSFVVHSALEDDGRRRLWLRRFDELETRPIVGTDGGTNPFLSPDGRWVGFEADNRIKKVPVGGGTPLPIEQISTQLLGGTWAADDVIVFTPTLATGLHRVDAAGGEGVQITFPDADRGEIAHIWPHAIPGTDKVLFTVQKDDGYDVALLSLGDESWSTVLEGGRQARYAPSGHLVYRADALQAVAFDVSAQRVTGASTALFSASWFDVASDGTLLYATVTGPGEEAGALAWIDRDGSVMPIRGGEAVARRPVLAPDGSRVALEVPVLRDVFVLDLSTGARTRIGFGGGINNFAVWSPDGQELVFNSLRSPLGVYRKRWDATGAADLFLPRPPQRPRIPASWSGRHGMIAYTELHEETYEDLWIVPADGSGDPSPLLVTPFRESVPLISPDGERIAYLSDESGIVEVYVASYPDLSGKTAVSSGGGTEPRWSSDGSELFFRVEDRMMAVRMGSDPRGGPSRPAELFRGRFRADRAFHYPQYDVAADGRFLMIQEPDSTAEGQSFGVVFNWFEELERLAPTGR